ncbi:hypothetical protein SAMN05216570_1152 [Dyella sp. OK004]|uniref:hypothetical protein n=1 Tax=Dyella sp. OK004 TaxID=1855292 RepID=UPI0008EFD13E|nr:hypothetical protein [Dyella sp. OK004]SFR95224.1 hypothetical protein SAMN05216570_1152 [Dyella sp. OK004]
MTKTRQDLEMMLAEIDAAIPTLLAKYPDPCEFWPAFDRMAEDAIECSGVSDDAEDEDDHRAWLCGRLDELMVKHHLVPPEDQI